jgi:prophage regulatory protein
MQPDTIEAAQADKPKRGVTVNPQPLHAAQIADALLKLATAAQLAGLSEATLYRKAKTDPSFPRLIRMGARCTRIRAGDLTAWLAAQAGA